MNTIALKGLDGSNPLHVLAALGVLRVISLQDEAAKLAWTSQHPFSATLDSRLTLKECHQAAVRHLGVRGCVALRTRQRRLKDSTSKKSKRQIKRIESVVKARLPAVLDRIHPFASRADCIHKVQRPVFREFGRCAGSALWAVLLPGLAADTEREYKKGEWGVSRTGFSFSNGGSGKALLKDWCSSLALLRGADPLDSGLLGFLLEPEETTGLMWDPVEQREYALRWSNPSNEDTYSIPVLNVFALIGLSLLPVLPGVSSDRTVGLHNQQRDFVWPLWSSPLRVECVAALLAMDGIASDAEAACSARGIHTRFVASIVAANKRNYFAVAHAYTSDGLRLPT